MNKADKYLKNTITKILEEGVTDENPRPRYSDNTPAHSKFITQQVFNFNVSKGEFPITTLRNGSLKLAFQEMKTIFIDQSNKEEDFVKNGITWWTPWMNEDGDLGTAYSFNLESVYKDSSTQLYEINRKIGTQSPLQDDFDFEELFTNQKHVLANKIIEGKFVKYKVLDKTSEHRYNIQLLDCGLIKNVSRSTIKHNAILSPYSKSLGGEFYYGAPNCNNFTEHDLSKILSMWQNIGDRITGKGANNRKYSLHNIDKRWTCFSNFLEDVPYIPQFFLAKRDGFKGWVLDKDYYGSSFYSKDTCVFIKNEDNLKYKNTQKIYKVGKFITDSTQTLSKYLCVSDRSIRYILEERNNKTCRKRKESTLELENRFEIIDNPDVVFRKPISKNQVIELLKNLENDRFSRRHMLSFFNWREQDDKQLVECAFQSLFSVRTVDGVNFIDQTLIQRSSDFIVAGMINSIQYVMLGTIICNHLKYKTNENWQLGNFTWFVQNCHMYDRHLEQAQELLEKEPTGLQPKIELVCEPKDFFRHTWEDFKVTGLEGIKKLNNKLEIAI